MKKLITSLLLIVAIATVNAQSNIPLVNGDCSTDAALMGVSPFVISGFTITQASSLLDLTNSGISGGKLRIVGTANSTKQGDVTITTSPADISAFPNTATFTFSCNLVCTTATGQAAPYNVMIYAYDANSTVVTASTTTLTKIQNNTNVAAGTVITIGGTVVMKPNTSGIGLDARYLTFQLQIGKIITSDLSFNNFSLNNLAAAPTTTVSAPTNAALSYEAGAGPSDESSFTVSGTNLISDVILTPTMNMEISTTSGYGFVASPSTITLTPTSGILAETTIYARLKSGILAVGPVVASTTRVNITNSLAGSKTVQFSGTVTGIGISTPLSTALSYVYGAGPSAEQTFNVSGQGLTADVVVTPGSNMEISTTTGTGFASTPITLTQVAGAVAATPIYARLIAGLAAATYNDATTKVVASSSGFTSPELQFIGTVTGPNSVSNTNISNYKFIPINGFIKVIGVEIGKEIEIFNSVGQKVKSVTATDHNNIALMTKGIYLIKVDAFVQKVLLR